MKDGYIISFADAGINFPKSVQLDNYNELRLVELEDGTYYADKDTWDAFSTELSDEIIAQGYIDPSAGSVVAKAASDIRKPVALEEKLRQALFSDQAPAGNTIPDKERGTARDPSPGQGLSGDGVTGEVSMGNVGNVTSFYCRIKLNTDNQIICSFQNSGDTAVSVVADVLTFGASLSESNILVDNVSKTNAEAGVLLNDNLWHELSFDLVSIDASDFRLFTDGTSFGDVCLHDIQLNAGVLGWWDGEINSGSRVADKSGNNNVGVIGGVVTVVTDKGILKSYRNDDGYLVADGVNHYEDAAHTILYPAGTHVPKISGGSTSVAYDSSGQRVALTYIGEVPLNGEVVGANAFLYDGATAYHELGTGTDKWNAFFQQDFKIIGRIDPDDGQPVAEKYFFGVRKGGISIIPECRVRLKTTGVLEFTYRVGAGTFTHSITGFTFAAGAVDPIRYEWSVSQNGIKVDFDIIITQVDGTIVNNNVTSAQDITMSDFDSEDQGPFLGAYNNNGNPTAYWDGPAFGLEFWNGTTLFDRIRSSEGNGRNLHGDVSKDIFILTGTEIWTTQDVYHASLTLGDDEFGRFDGVTSGVQVQSSSGGLVDIFDEGGSGFDLEIRTILGDSPATNFGVILQSAKATNNIFVVGYHKNDNAIRAAFYTGSWIKAIEVTGILPADALEIILNYDGTTLSGTVNETTMVSGGNPSANLSTNEVTIGHDVGGGRQLPMLLRDIVIDSVAYNLDNDFNNSVSVDNVTLARLPSIWASQSISNPADWANNNAESGVKRNPFNAPSLISDYGIDNTDTVYTTNLFYVAKGEFKNNSELNRQPDWLLYKDPTLLTTPELVEIYEGLYQYKTDADIDAFLAADVAGDFANDDIIAVKQYVFDQKLAGLWDVGVDIVSDWPELGATAASQVLDLRRAHDAVLFGGYIHSSTGIKPNGTNAYRKTGIIPSTDLKANEFTFEVYIREAGSQSWGRIFGASDGNEERLMLVIKAPTDQFLVDGYNKSGGRLLDANGAPNANGHWIATRRSAIDVEAYRNGVSFLSGTQGGGTVPPLELYADCENIAESPITYSDRKTAGRLIGNGLTSIQVMAQYICRQNMNLIKGRAV